jgi:hypothetical protein
MMGMWKSAGIAAALSALFLTVAATSPLAQQQTPAHTPPLTSGDPVVDAVCKLAIEAKTVEETKKLWRDHSTKHAWSITEAEQKLAEARRKVNETESTLKADEKAAADAKAKLSSLLTSRPTAEEHAAERAKAQKEIREIRELDSKYQDAKADLDVFAKATPGSRQNKEELARRQHEVRTRKRILDMADENAVQERLKQATDGYNEKTAGIVTLRAAIAGLDQNEATSRRALERARTAVTQAGTHLAAMRAREQGVQLCIRVRSAQLDPENGPRLRQLDELLDRIERRIAELETRAPQLASQCAPIVAEIEALQREAAGLGRDADALAAKAAAPQAGAADYQRRFNQASQAERDARSAAAAISSARTHAAKAAQNACTGSEAITKNLADPGARTRLIDVQRSRTEAEQDVAQTAAALDRIRAAHASVVAAGPLQTPLTRELAGLKSRAAELKRRRDAAAMKATDPADFSMAVEAIVTLLRQHQSNAKSEFSHTIAERLREFRISELLGRAERIERSCGPRARNAALEMDRLNRDAIAKVDNVTSAVGNTGVLADPPSFGPEIERTFNAARTEAEAVAAEATKAVRCEATARNALANPPACKGTPPAGAVLKPDPSRKGGLTCLYRCGSSSIEFTVFDGTTACPPKIEDYTLVSSTRTPSGGTGGALVQSGPAVVKKGTNSRSGVQEFSSEFTATTARQVEVDGTVYRREIIWKFTAPPVSLSPGEEIRIDVSGKAEVIDKGTKVKLPNAASAGVRVRGLDQVKGELASADTGSSKGSTYVFRVPANAKGATIEFGADWNLGVFASYYYGDHKKP